MNNVYEEFYVGDTVVFTKNVLRDCAFMDEGDMIGRVGRIKFIGSSVDYVSVEYNDLIQIVYKGDISNTRKVRSVFNPQQGVARTRPSPTVVQTNDDSVLTNVAISNTISFDTYSSGCSDSGSDSSSSSSCD